MYKIIIRVCIRDDIEESEDTGDYKDIELDGEQFPVALLSIGNKIVLPSDPVNWRIRDIITDVEEKRVVVYVN